MHHDKQIVCESENVSKYGIVEGFKGHCVVSLLEVEERRIVLRRKQVRCVLRLSTTVCLIHFTKVAL
jgi:hypothetical protein